MSTGQGPLFRCQNLPTCVYENKHLPYYLGNATGVKTDALEMSEWEIERRSVWRSEKNFDLEENMDFIDYPGPNRLYGVTLKYCRENFTFSERRRIFAL